ncbi:sod_Ni_protease, nickel-type superoxide dismutase maturation protease [actinobacterium SCGC AAA044-D11]
MKKFASLVSKLVKRIEVRGNSMAPSYNEGDWLLFYTGPGRWRGKSRFANSLIGKVVLIRQSPELLIVKRVLRVISENSDEKKYWVEGDNKLASTDSRNWGEVASSKIVGVLLFRYHRESN